MNLDKELSQIINIGNGFIPMKELANTIFEENNEVDVIKIASELFQNDAHQIRMVAVFLFGKLSSNNIEVLEFMKSEVSKDDNWRIQEILAMAFDTYCHDIGYEKSLPIIKEWLKDLNCNTRRAVSEGLRIWTGRAYFKDNPQVAIELLSQLKNDESAYVRKSCGNALRDISKKYPQEIVKAMSTWNETKEEQQVKKLILKNKKLQLLLEK